MTMDLYTHVSNEKSARDIEKIVPDKMDRALTIPILHHFSVKIREIM